MRKCHQSNSSPEGQRYLNFIMKLLKSSYWGGEQPTTIRHILKTTKDAFRGTPLYKIKSISTQGDLPSTLSLFLVHILSFKKKNPSLYYSLTWFLECHRRHYSDFGDSSNDRLSLLQVLNSPSPKTILKKIKEIILNSQSFNVLGKIMTWSETTIIMFKLTI